MKKKNLVMGSGSGYDWNTLEPFVTSFVRNCPSAQLVLFANDISDFTQNCLLEQGGIIIEPFKVVTHPVNDRWKCFLDYLEQYGDKYEQVLCTDTRDAIFQSDVFEAFKDRSAYLGYTTEYDEISGKNTGKDVNYRWLIKYFDKETADKLAKKPIICSGTIIGTVEEMKIFLRTLIDHISKYGSGSDQVAEQYIIHNNLLPIKNLIEIDCDHGVILTSYLFHMRHPVKTLGDKIVRDDNDVPAVVHQYDRQKSLIDFVDKNYRDKNFPADSRFNDVRSIIEQATQLLYVDKVNEATQLFMSTFFNSETFVGEIDRLLKLWSLSLKKTASPAITVLEFSIQNILQSAKDLSVAHLNRISELLFQSIKLKRENNLPQMKNIVFRHIFSVFDRELKKVEGKVADKIQKRYFLLWMDIINTLDLPPNKDFYFNAAKANRIIGRKKEALESYTKFLELS